MKIQNFFSAIDISATGLTANRQRIDAISSNIANAQTTRTEEGGAYKRKITTFEENNTWVNFNKFLEDEKLKLDTTDGSHLWPEDYVKYKHNLTGVQADITRDQSAPTMVYDPTHPDANPEGYVSMPNVNVVSEMVDLIAASRSYEANVTALNATKGMIRNALMI